MYDVGQQSHPTSVDGFLTVCNDDAFRVGEAGGATTTPPRPLRRGERGGGGILRGEETEGLAGPGPPPAIEASHGVVYEDDTTGFKMGVLVGENGE